MKIRIKYVFLILLLSTLFLLAFIIQITSPEYFSIDWIYILNFISSLSALGTLIVAIMAYITVPKWIHQKSDEVSFNLANDLICNIFPELIDSIERVVTPFNFLTKKYYINTESFFLQFKGEVEKVRGDIWEINTKVRNIERSLLVLRRHGWNLKQPQKEICENLLKDFTTFFSAYLAGSTTIHILKWPDPQECEKENILIRQALEDEIFENRNLVMQHADPFLRELNVFLDSRIEVEDFFTRKTK